MRIGKPRGIKGWILVCESREEAETAKRFVESAIKGQRLLDNAPKEQETLQDHVGELKANELAEVSEAVRALGGAVVTVSSEDTAIAKEV